MGVKKGCDLLKNGIASFYPLTSPKPRGAHLSVSGS